MSVVDKCINNSLPHLLRQGIFICSAYLLLSFEKDYNIYLLAELKNRLKINIFLWRKSCASR